MDPDLDLLDYLCHKGAHYIEAAVAGEQHHPRTVVGVGIFLLDHDGNIDLLTAKQRVTYDKFLRPLLFDVPCQEGAGGSTTCRGNGRIEADLLLKSYRDGEFRCRRCRERMG
ncbi:MAG: hypothetical protein ACYC9I_06310 [Desulfuromonadales bacterium]